MNFKNTIIKQLVNELEKEGKRILQECQDERTYTNRSFNLYDSYGYAVYVEKTLKTMGYLGGKTAKKGKKWYGETIEGRTAITDFFNSGYKPKDGIELVIAAAMPYAQVLENGGASNERFSYRSKYKVVSMAYDKLKELSAKLPTSTIHSIINGKAQ